MKTIKDSWLRNQIKLIVCVSIGTMSVTSLQGCNSGESQNEASRAVQAADSTVVGKDTSPVDVRNDINHSDAEKLTLPGRDTTNSDVSNKKLKDSGQ